jgi:hypothetical protein
MFFMNEYVGMALMIYIGISQIPCVAGYRDGKL